MKKYSDLYNEEINGVLKSSLIDFYNGMTMMVPEEKVMSDTVTHDILFSGGYDSTLILLRALELYKLGYINKISTITVEGITPRLQGDAEKQSRERILNYIEETYNIEIENNVIKINLYGSVKRAGYSMQHLYTSASLICAGTKSILHTGFNSDDSSTIYFRNLVGMGKNIDAYYSANTETNIIAPLALYTKSKIIYELMRDFPEVYKMLWTCQETSYIGNEPQMCYSCPKCKDLIHALNNIKYNHMDDDSFNDINNYLMNKINKEKEEYENRPKETLKVEEDNK